MTKVIEISDDLSIKNIKTFHQSLLNDIKENDKIVLNFSMLNRMDMAVAQVVMAFIRESKNSNKKIKIKGLKESLKEQFILCGIIKEKIKSE